MTTLAPAPADTLPAAPRRRTLVALAVAFLAGLVVLLATGGSDLEPDASLGDIQAAYDQSHAVVAWGGYATMALCALLVFVGVAHRTATQVRGRAWTADVAMLGFVVLALTVASWSVSGLAVWHAVDQGEDASVRTLNFVDTANFLPLMTGMVCVYVGTGLTGLANRSLPVPLAVLSLLLGVAAPLGPLGFASVGLLPLWLVVVSARVRLEGPTRAAP